MQSETLASNTGPRLRLDTHMPALDGIRGLAVLMVLIFHFIGNTLATNAPERVVTGIANYGAFGVELFFILSGFLITGILYDGRDKPSYFRHFYMRRVLRIFPLYYGVLALVLLVAPLLPPFQGPTLDFLVKNQAWAWLYGVNVYIAKEAAWSFSYLDHFWSLAVEEHFYFFWPLVVFLLAGRPRTLIAVCLGISACALLGRMAGPAMGLHWWTTYVLTPFRLDGLTLGAFMAVYARQPGGLERMTAWLPRAAAVAAGLLAFTYLASRLSGGTPSDTLLALRSGAIQALLACLLFFTLVAPARSAISRFFTSRPMVFLGTYSYGLYVYHHFFSYYFSSNRTELQLAQWLRSHSLAVGGQPTAGILASLVIAYLSYEYFETRFLALKKRYAGDEGSKSPARTLGAGA